MLDKERINLINHEHLLFGREPMVPGQRSKRDMEEREARQYAGSERVTKEQEERMGKRMVRHHDMTNNQSAHNYPSNPALNIDRHTPNPYDAAMKDERMSVITDHSVNRPRSVKQRQDNLIKEDSSSINKSQDLSENRAFPFVINPHPRVLDSQQSEFGLNLSFKNIYNLNYIVKESESEKRRKYNLRHKNEGSRDIDGKLKTKLFGKFVYLTCYRSH